MVEPKNNHDKLIVVGALMGAHGVKGDVKVKSFTAEPEDVFAYGDLLDQDGRLILAPKSVRPARAHFIVTSEPVRSREEWDAMKGVKLYVPLEALPEIDDDEVYVDELLGVSAIDPDGLVLGRIKAVQNYGAGDLLEISPAIGGKSVLIPFTQEDVPSVDINAGQVTIASWALWSEDKDS